MKLTVIQILLVLFSVFVLTRTLQRFKSQKLNLWQIIAWTLLWVSVIVVALRPETTSALARFLGVGRGADVIVYFALVTVFYLHFRMFAKVEDLERQITKLVRSVALKDLDEEQKNRKE